MIPRCAACARFVWYPRERCPACGGAELPWARVSGRGSLFAWAVVRHPLWKPYADRIPYATGLVALAEDPAVRLVSLLVDCAPEALRVAMPLQAVFRPLAFPGVARRLVAPLFAPV